MQECNDSRFHFGIKIIITICTITAFLQWEVRCQSPGEPAVPDHNSFSLNVLKGEVADEGIQRPL